MAAPALGASRTGAAELLARNPGLVPSGVAFAVLLWFAGDEGGFRGTTWMPAMLLLLAVLFVCLVALPRPRPSRAALAAMLLLTGYGLFSLLSILWAEQEELAWDGGNRTLLYALVFALCALWPLRGRAAALLLGAFGLGIAVIALFELLKAGGAEQAIQYFYEGRFSEPVGYANANVALWMLGLVPCVVLAGRRELPAALRGVLLGAAVLLGGAALLGQSRGWVLALPVAALIAILVVPGRGRTIAAMGAVGAAVALISPPLLDVYSDWRPYQPPGDVFDSALRALFMASVLLAFVGAAAALVDRSVELGERSAQLISSAAVGAVALALVVGVVGYTVVEGNPVSAVSEKWDEFKEGGSESSSATGRLSGGVATYRYDYWRVAWDEFERAPLVGAGADNFGRAYLEGGESTQTPRYPHSTEMVALAETGLIGTLLLLGGIVAALAAALPALRRPDLTGVAAGTGVLLFGYWLAHSSLDWLWEFPGLAGPALAGLGLAVGLAALAPGDSNEPGGARPLLAGRRALAVAGLCALLVAASVTPPWLAEREQRRATRIASSDPDGAVDRLDRAASLNPLSPVPDKAAGIIEIRRGGYAAAERELREAFERDGGDSGLYLLLGVLASEDGREREALRLVREADRLAPRDAVTTAALERLEAGRRVDPQQVDRWITRDVRSRIGAD
jgi:tetratricopeptide (TPR) repeat protein